MRKLISEEDGLLRHVVRCPTGYRVPGVIVWRILLSPWAISPALIAMLAAASLAAGQWRQALTCGAILIVWTPGIVALTWLFYGRSLLHYYLAIDGAKATGRVVKYQYRPFNRGPSNYLVYEWTQPSGKVRRGREPIAQDQLETFAEGQPMSVLYVRSAPFLAAPEPLCEYERQEKQGAA